MKAVFLDRSTFSDNIDLPKPQAITDYQVYKSTPQDDNVIIKRCQKTDIIITNKVILNRHILESLPNLKLVQLTATGTNNVDTVACQSLNIALNNIAGYAVKSVPEHTFMLMLNAMRAARYYHQSVIGAANKKTNTTDWQQSGKFCLMDETIYDLEGKTLGIIGAGTIGRRVGEIAKAFGMSVLFSERQNKPPRSDDYTAFDNVLQKSDVITLHCPLTAETKQLINSHTITKMSKKPLIVNVARGEVVDSTAVVNALQSEQLLGYASDVFETEPMSHNDPLFKLANHPRVFFTPHNAWGSLSAQEQLWDILCNQINSYINTNKTLV